MCIMLIHKLTVRLSSVVRAPRADLCLVAAVVIFVIIPLSRPLTTACARAPGAGQCGLE